MLILTQSPLRRWAGWMFGLVSRQALGQNLTKLDLAPFLLPEVPSSYTHMGSFHTSY